jgi:hypothetical protein
MKKNYSILKTIVGVAIVLTILQGCVPVSVNPPATSNLTGKIKSNRMYTISSSDTLDRLFQYDSSGRLSRVDVFYNNTFYYQYTVQYQPNKIILNDSTNSPVNIYYLKAGTNLIDSVYSYSSGLVGITYSIRDVSNNLNQINSNIVGTLLSTQIDSIEYTGTNISSLKNTSYDPFQFSTKIRYENFTYDLGRNTRIYTETIIGAIGAISESAFGISYGNTNTNAITSYTVNQTTYPEFSETKTYNYILDTPTKVIIEETNNTIVKRIENEYY